MYFKEMLFKNVQYKPYIEVILVSFISILYIFSLIWGFAFFPATFLRLFVL